MDPVTLKEAVCQQYAIKESEFESFVLKRTLFLRVRLVRPFIRFFYPEFLFHERRLVRSVERATSLKDIQEEVDFYQHKYVVSSPFKDALRFRLSGLRLLSLASMSFSRVKKVR